MSALVSVPFALPMAPPGFVWVMLPTKALKQARPRRPRSPEAIEAHRQRLVRAWAQRTKLAAERRSARPPHEQKRLERQRNRMRLLRQRRKQEDKAQAARGGRCVSEIVND